MNRRELLVKQKLEGDGWRVLRNGAPDFVALKVQDGEIVDMKGVEVKSKTGRLTYEQGVYRQIFAKAGIPFEVNVVD